MCTKNIIQALNQNFGFQVQVKTRKQQIEESTKLKQKIHTHENIKTPCSRRNISDLAAGHQEKQPIKHKKSQN